MTRCLIVANQTLGGAALEREVRSLIAGGTTAFHILVPMIEPQLESTAWMVADVGGFAIPPPSTSLAEAEDDARRRSQQRLDRMIDEIRSSGGEADGEVGPTDPVVAVRQALEREHFDRVVVSTLPARLSRWLRIDLPSRLSRCVDVPVVAVEAEG